MNVLKAQAGIALALMVFLVLIALMAFLYDERGVKERSFSYEDDYASSILYSLLRSTTNSTDIKCRQVNDIVNIYLFGVIPETHCCKIYDMYCNEFILSTLEEKLNIINSTFKKQYRMYFEIGTEQPNGNEIVRYTYGDKRIKDCKTNKVSAVSDLGAGETEKSRHYAKIIIVRSDDLCLR